GTARIACFTVGAHHILLCERAATVDHTFVEDPKVHHSFTVRPETLVRACKLFRERHIRIEHLYHRKEGVFPGRELYFFDPSGNRLELPDPTWHAGMPEPSLEELSHMRMAWRPRRARGTSKDTCTRVRSRGEEIGRWCAMPGKGGRSHRPSSLCSRHKAVPSCRADMSRWCCAGASLWRRIGN